jgi:hypothetical protein
VSAQASGLYRFVGVVSEVLPGKFDPVREYFAEEEGVVWIRLSVDHSGPVAGGFREDRDKGRSAAPDFERECDPLIEAREG